MAANASPPHDIQQQIDQSNTHRKNRRTVTAPQQLKATQLPSRPAQRQDAPCKRTMNAYANVGCYRRQRYKAAHVVDVRPVADDQPPPHRPAQPRRPSGRAQRSDIDGSLVASRSSTTRRRNSTRYSAAQADQKSLGDQKTKIEGIWPSCWRAEEAGAPAQSAGRRQRNRRRCPTSAVAPVRP